MNKYNYINLNYKNEDLNNTLDIYLKFLIISGLFYITPSIQFVMYQSNNVINCYYNFKCKYSYYFIPAFNNVISNILYVIYGLVYIIIVKFKPNSNKDFNDLGIYKNKSLYYCLGICLIFEGISSAFYHICPSRLNLQFDTTFMFIGILYSYLTLYNKRHFGDICNPLKFYIMIFMLIVLNILSLVNKTNNNHIWFWLIIFIITTYCLIFTSIYIYTGKHYDFDIKSFSELLKLIKNENLIKTPKFWMILSSNTFTVGMLLYASFIKPYFIGWMLMIGLVNLLIYFIYYLSIKILNKEKIMNIIIVFMFVDIIFMAFSLYFYSKTNYNTFIDIKESNKINEKCILFNYFDNHDIWHFMSSTTLFIFMLIILFIDFDLEYQKIEIFNEL